MEAVEIAPNILYRVPKMILGKTKTVIGKLLAEEAESRVAVIDINTQTVSALIRRSKMERGVSLNEEAGMVDVKDLEVMMGIKKEESTLRTRLVDVLVELVNIGALSKGESNFYRTDLDDLKQQLILEAAVDGMFLERLNSQNSMEKV